MNTLVPRARILLGGATLEEWGLRPFLRSVTCTRSTDRVGDSRKKQKGRTQRDSATLVFDNTDHQVVRQLAMRERVEIHLGYDGMMHHRGTYLTYSPSISYGSDDMTVSMDCQDLSIKLMEGQVSKDRKWFGGVTLEQVVRQVANSYGMASDVHSSLKDLEFRDLQSERREPDWQFLERLIHLSGAGFMYVDPASHLADDPNDTIVIRPFGFNIEKLPVDTRPRPLKLGYRVHSADVPIGSASVRLDPEKGLKVIGADLDSKGAKTLVFRGDTKDKSTVVQLIPEADVGSADRLTLGKGLASVGEAGAFYPPGLVFIREFEDSVRLWKMFAVELSIELPIGFPALYPLQLVDLEGLGPFSGKAIATSVKDTYGSDGYSQTLSVRSASALDAIGDTDAGFKTLLFRGDGANQSTVVELVPEADIQDDADGATP